MSEWWTYRLSDFLLFSPRTYYRLFELYNDAVWPAHLGALALGAALPALLLRGGAPARRMAAAVLALAWLWVGWAFHWQRYAAINWAAVYPAGAFAAEALLLLWLGAVRDRLRLDARAAWWGLALFVFALAVMPLIGPLLGRPWSQAELFGLAPDPTAVATLGLAAALHHRTRWALLGIPLAWCAAGGATLWTMGAPDAAVLPLAGLAALAIAASAARRG